METARQLLAELSVAEMPDFISYALDEARRTNFDVQTLGGIKLYLAGYMTRKKHRKSAGAKEAARLVRERQEADQSAYDIGRRAEAAKLFETLSPEEQAEIEKEARTYAASFSGSLSERMFGSRKVQITVRRHAATLKTFEQWKADTSKLYMGGVLTKESGVSDESEWGL